VGIGIAAAVLIRWVVFVVTFIRRDGGVAAR